MPRSGCETYPALEGRKFRSDGVYLRLHVDTPALGNVTQLHAKEKATRKGCSALHRCVKQAKNG